MRRLACDKCIIFSQLNMFFLGRLLFFVNLGSLFDPFRVAVALPHCRQYLSIEKYIPKSLEFAICVGFYSVSKLSRVS
jgi:hypothetical protein